MVQTAKPTRSEAESDNDWVLNADQMIFMLQHHNAVAAAYEANDLAFLRSLAESKGYKAVFGNMSWDEAFDRYEEMLSVNPDADA